MTNVRVAILIASIVAAMCAAPAARAGDGAEGTALGIQFGYPGNVGASCRLNNIAIGAAWSFGDNGYLHATIDYWLLHNKLADNLNWYLGPGVNLGLGDPFALGVRVPVGLQWLPTKNLEVFGEVAPSLWLIETTDFDFNGAVGIRYVF